MRLTSVISFGLAGCVGSFLLSLELAIILGGWRLGGRRNLHTAWRTSVALGLWAAIATIPDVTIPEQNGNFTFLLGLFLPWQSWFTSTATSLVAQEDKAPKRTGYIFWLAGSAALIVLLKLSPIREPLNRITSPSPPPINAAAELQREEQEAAQEREAEEHTRIEARLKQEADQRARLEAQLKLQVEERARLQAAATEAERARRQAEGAAETERQRQAQEAQLKLDAEERESLKPPPRADDRADTIAAPHDEQSTAPADGRTETASVSPQSPASSPPSMVSPLTAAQERGLKPKETFKECAQCPEMVVVPAGKFTMGSSDNEKGRDKDEGPQHIVTIGKPFAVGKFHVTVHQFAAFVAATGYNAGSNCWTVEGGKQEERSDRSWQNPGFAQAGSHPAVCLSWNDAKAYVDWVAQTTGRPYRLLTEAEWEYAARGQIKTGQYPRYSFGNDEKDLCRFGNGADWRARDTIDGAKNWPTAPCDDGYAYTSPVGSFAPNGFGLYDMQGNAWQWTVDCYHDSYSGAPADGSAWTAEDCHRVFRGGSWSRNPRVLRAATREGGTRDIRGNGVGFRIARTLAP
jgi:formylglycine-generating enzyme required for sulfatase activity